MGFFLDFLKKGWTDFKGLTPLQQVAYMMVMMGIVSGLIVTILYTSRPNYQVLFANLEADDAGQIVTYLKDNKIPYKLATGGTTVMVPGKDVYELRMNLANEGMPLGGSSGWEIFDNQGMGMTEFEQKVTYQRALQGELIRSIQEIKKIDKARLHLVTPEKALFKEDQQEPTASVILKLHNGAELSSDEVKGIIHLVASAVEGLKPTKVTVMDSRGEMLSSIQEEESKEASLNGSLLELKQNIEREKERQIVSLLGKTIGTDKIVAKVTVDLDFNRILTREEKYDSEEPAVRSKTMVEESNSGTEVQNASTPGVSADQLTTEAATDQTKNNQQSRRVQEVVNNEISTTTTETISPAGKIDRLSIAVLLDGKYEAVKGENAEGAAKEKKYTPWNDEELKKFEELAKTAVGFDAKRGDQITLANISFQNDENWTEQALFPESNKEMILTLVNYGLILLGALAFFFLVLRPLISWLTTEEDPITDEAIQQLLPSRVVDFEERLLEGAIDDQPENSGPSSDEQFEFMRRQLHDRRRVAIENARRDRKAITMMIRKWLKEDANAGKAKEE